MNRIYKIYYGLLFFCVSMALILLMPACKKSVEGSPVITEVRNYIASPGDSVLSGVVPDGQWVVITGQNLQNALQITFNGVPASYNNALFSSNSVVVQIPSIVFSTIDTNKLNTIEYTTPGGTTTFSFKLTPAVPTITAISDVFANPGDSVFIYGENLVLVQSFSYGGTNIASFRSDYYGTSLGFVMPNPAPTSGDVVATTRSGTVVFKIVATPTITGVSNENPAVGDSVYVYGTYLKSIQTFIYAGASVTSFASSADGKFVGFKSPALTTQSGPVSITTAFGTATTPYNVNTQTYLQDGVIMNFEGGWSFNGMEGWWGSAGGAVNNSANDPFGWLTKTTAFDGVYGTNNTLFPFLNMGVMAAGDGNNWGGTGTNLKPNQWMPASNLSDPVDNWAIKFEMSVPNPWNGISLCFETYFDGSYKYRFEPWQTAVSSTTPFTTKGWVTVTIPLSAFRAKSTTLGEGMGTPVTSIAALLGTGNTGLRIYCKNFGTKTSATGFYGAFDNCRIVKIK
ncbi:hypothetical protein FAM09_09625 [Niastella caeni]|uniref:Surface glycan-binding protein B xyloglucan binding domain-containing protein n=1 Tax=Niastella caeni TaxID=2569763 RepID=A0A4S8I0W9_9BACT|nr:glycan-binding surface protein [Niastella caeni]THU40134.1 hypothetical protein FAM09_09625 [Niastella caeni]